MASWRDQILKEFTPQVARLTLVADPDSLLTEENLLQEIQARGFELIPFEDRIVFRFAYESKYRDRKESGELTDLVVVLRSESHELRSLPYDLLQAGRQLSFSLKDLFPNLSYPIVKTSEPLETLLDVQSSRFQALQEKVDTAFLTWVMQRYGGLYNQPALKSVMLHQIPRFLARHLQEQAIQKVALLVLDGLALDQWLVLQNVLAKQRPQLRFRSEAVFAWLPTITSVSRQAVFAGKPPIYFPGSIHKTDKEATV